MKLEKRNTLSNDIIFIDGLWGTGKSLLGPIVSGMSGVEKEKFEHIYEYICVLSLLNKIDKDAAVWMLRNYSDMSQYNNVIGREVNLRWNDLSGFFNNPNVFRYISRLFSVEGDERVSEINDNNLALCIMSHNLMLAPQDIGMAFGARVKIIEMVRHPLYMVQHISRFLSRFDVLRNFTMSFHYNDTKVPWFANEWASEYIEATDIERAVLCICRLYPRLKNNLDKSRADGADILELPFEMAAFDTYEMLIKLEEFLGRNHHKKISSILKKQKLPRKTVAQGRGQAHYGWVRSLLTERETYHELNQMVKDNCSVKIYEEMIKIIDWYNIRYPSSLSELASF